MSELLIPFSFVTVYVVIAYLLAISNEWTYEKSTTRSVLILRKSFSMLGFLISASTRLPFESIYASMIAFAGLEASDVVNLDKIMDSEIVSVLLTLDFENEL